MFSHFWALWTTRNHHRNHRSVQGATIPRSSLRPRRHGVRQEGPQGAGRGAGSDLRRQGIGAVEGFDPGRDRRDRRAMAT